MQLRQLDLTSYMRWLGRVFESRKKSKNVGLMIVSKLRRFNKNYVGTCPRNKKMIYSKSLLKSNEIEVNMK